MSITNQKTLFCQTIDKTKFFSAPASFYWLQRSEPLSFTLQYPEIRKALKYGISEFKTIYTAYKKQWGAVKEQRDTILGYLQCVERLSPSEFATHRSEAIKVLCLTRKQLEPVFHGFNSLNLMSDRDLELSAKCTEMVVEIVGEGK